MGRFMIGAGAALLAAASTSGDTMATEPTNVAATPTGESAGGATTRAGGPDGFPLTITDAAGAVHTFDEPPQIGCAWAGCREGLADLGMAAHAEGWVEGTVDAFNYPNGGPEHAIEDTENPEHWAAAEVDVIVKRVPDTPEDAALEQAAPIFYLHHPSYGDSSQTGLDAYYENMRLLGQLTGETQAAQDAIDRFDATVAALQAAAPDGAAETIFAPMYGNFVDSYRISGSENPFCDALARYELGACVDVETGEMNGEAFLALDPDWIGVMVFDDSEGDSNRSDPVWGRLSAVEDGHVFEAQSRIYCCSLRGLTHALQEYAHYVWGDEGGIPAPGTLSEFDPTTDAVR